jgi:hypothetical protein
MSGVCYISLELRLPFTAVLRNNVLEMKVKDGVSLHLGNNCVLDFVQRPDNVKFTLEQDTKAQRVSRGIAVLFL